MRLEHNKIILKTKIDYDNIEYYFKNLFIKLMKNNTEINGFYISNIYHDKIYGDIIELIKKDELSNQIDIEINIIDTTFLYQIDRYDLDLDYFDIYKYNNEIYAKIKNKLAYNDYLKLLENSKIIYDTEKIFLNAEKI